MKIFRFIALLFFFIASSSGPSDATPVFVNLGPNKVVSSVSRSSDGTVYLVGYERSPQTGLQSAILVTIAPGSIVPQITTLGILPGTTESSASHVRGNYIVGGAAVGPSVHGVAWNLSDPSTAISVQSVNNPGRGDNTALFGVNSSGVYSGTSGQFGIAITGNVGGNSTILNSPSSATTAVGISELGWAVGRYLDNSGNGINAVVWQDPSTYAVLNNPFSDEATALSISPNNIMVGGSIGVFDPISETSQFQAAVWSGENFVTPELLLLPSGAPLIGDVLGVTDNGYAVGNSSLGGFIWHQGWTTAQLFNDWALNEFGISIPTWVTSVNDVFFDGTNLNFALQGSAYFMSVEVTPSSVPEPTTWIMLAISLFSFQFIRFRKLKGFNQLH